MTPRKRYSFWINEVQAEGLKAVKAAEDITESEQIRQALNDWLRKKEVVITKAPNRLRANEADGLNLPTGRALPERAKPMAKKRHPRHPKEHDLLKAIRRTPPNVAGELPAAKQRAPRKPKPSR